MVDDPLPFLTQRTDVVEFLRSFFEAIARRDWPAVAISFHKDASLFAMDPHSNMPEVLRWDAAAKPFREWLETSAGVRRFGNLVEELELSVTDKTAFVTLPATKRQPGARVMVLTLEDDRWQIHHLHLFRLQIPVFQSDIA